MCSESGQSYLKSPQTTDTARIYDISVRTEAPNHMGWVTQNLTTSKQPSIFRRRPHRTGKRRASAPFCLLGCSRPAARNAFARSNVGQAYQGNQVAMQSLPMSSGLLLFAMGVSGHEQGASGKKQKAQDHPNDPLSPLPIARLPVTTSLNTIPNRTATRKTGAPGDSAPAETRADSGT